MFDQKRKIKERLQNSFGKVKDESFTFELIESYFKKKDKKEAFQVLSDKTCNDLDFNELFMFVDRTTSKIGQQCLYDTLKTISSNDDKLINQEKIIDKISSDPNLRLNLQLQLDKLVKDDTYYITSLFQHQHVKEPKWFFVTRLLSFTSLLSLFMLPFSPPFVFLLFAIFIVNFGIHIWNKRFLYQYLGSIPQLLILNNVAREFSKYDFFNEIDHDISASISVIDKVRNRMSFFKLENKVEGDFEIIFWAMLEFVKILFLLEPLLGS